MLALVRIQMCSLLILDCKAVLLPGNYTARAGRQTYFQHTSLKGERVFLLSLPLLQVRACQEALERSSGACLCFPSWVWWLGSFSRTWTCSKLCWVSAVGVGHCRLKTNQPPSTWGGEGEEMGSWQRVFLRDSSCQKWGSLLIIHWTNRLILKVGARVSDVVIHCREHHTPVPYHWRTEARAKCGWVNQDLCSVVPWVTVKYHGWGQQGHIQSWGHVTPPLCIVQGCEVTHTDTSRGKDADFCPLPPIFPEPTVFNPGPLNQGQITCSYSKAVFCVCLSGTVLSDRGRQKLWRNGTYEPCQSLALCHHPLHKETCKPFWGSVYRPKHNHVFSA